MKFQKRYQNAPNNERTNTRRNPQNSRDNTESREWFRNKNRKKNSNNNRFSISSKNREGSNVRRTLPEGAVPEIKRPVLTEEEIERNQKMPLSVFTDFFDEESHAIISFEKAIELVKRKMTIEGQDSLVYLGSGNFAIVAVEEIHKKKRRLVVKEKIAFENTKESKEWRDKYRYDVAIPELSEPTSLSELYTDEEIANFPLNRRKNK